MSRACRWEIFQVKKWDKPTMEECLSLEWFRNSKYLNVGGVPGSRTGVT